MYLQIFGKNINFYGLCNFLKMKTSPIFRHWTHKNIPDRQLSALFQKMQKMLNHSTLISTVGNEEVQFFRPLYRILISNKVFSHSLFVPPLSESFKLKPNASNFVSAYKGRVSQACWNPSFVSAYKGRVSQLTRLLEP